MAFVHPSRAHLVPHSSHRPRASEFDGLGSDFRALSQPEPVRERSPAPTRPCLTPERPLEPIAGPSKPPLDYFERRQQDRASRTDTLWARSPSPRGIERPAEESRRSRRRTSPSGSSDSTSEEERERRRRKRRKDRRERDERGRDRRKSASIEEEWVEKPVVSATLPTEDDAADIGPMPAPQQARGQVDYGNGLLRGEGASMAEFTARGARIPRRGEIGMVDGDIDRYERAGFVMSGSRNERMNAVRLRKENQVISAEEKRSLLALQAEEKAKREAQLVIDFKEQPRLSAITRAEGLRRRLVHRPVRRRVSVAAGFSCPLSALPQVIHRSSIGHNGLLALNAIHRSVGQQSIRDAVTTKGGDKSENAQKKPILWSLLNPSDARRILSASSSAPDFGTASSFDVPLHVELIHSQPRQLIRLAPLVSVSGLDCQASSIDWNALLGKDDTSAALQAPAQPVASLRKSIEHRRKSSRDLAVQLDSTHSMSLRPSARRSSTMPASMPRLEAQEEVWDVYRESSSFASSPSTTASAQVAGSTSVSATSTTSQWPASTPPRVNGFSCPAAPSSDTSYLLQSTGPSPAPARSDASPIDGDALEACGLLIDRIDISFGPAAIIGHQTSSRPNRQEVAMPCTPGSRVGLSQRPFVNPSKPTTLDQPDIDVDAELGLRPMSARQRRSNAERQGRIPRPPNSFMLYRADQLKRIAAQPVSKTPQASLSQLIGDAWRAESPEVRAHYSRESELRKLAHQVLYPDYKYIPGEPKTKYDVYGDPIPPTRRYKPRKGDPSCPSPSQRPARSRTTTAESIPVFDEVQLPPSPSPMPLPTYERYFPAENPVMCAYEPTPSRLVARKRPIREQIELASYRTDEMPVYGLAIDTSSPMQYASSLTPPLSAASSSSSVNSLDFLPLPFVGQMQLESPPSIVMPPPAVQYFDDDALNAWLNSTPVL